MDRTFDLAAKLFEGDALKVTIKHLRVNVAASTDGRRVAQTLGHMLDRSDKVALSLLLIFGLADFRKLYGGKQRPSPRPKIFGGKLLGGRSLDVLVHVARTDGAHFPLRLVFLEELCPANLFNITDERGEFFINVQNAMADVMLADEVEREPTATLNLQMTITQGRDAVSAIMFDALFRADAKVKIVDETHDDGQHALARVAFEVDVLVGLASQGRQMLAEAFDLLVLFALLARGKLRVIDVLDAPDGINPDGLQAVARRRRDTHHVPRGRSHEQFDAR